MLELLAFGDTGWGDELLRGAGFTVLVAILSFVLGFVFGGIGAGAKLSDGLIRRSVADVYTTVVRGVPELLIIYLLFFGSDPLIQAVARGFGFAERPNLDAFTVSVLAVGLISGAYSTEVLRGAVLAVPKGQIEAARAVGMHPVLIFRRIMIPQIMRYALPGLGNVWQLTIKDTALVSVTGLHELMDRAAVASGSTRQPFIFYVSAAALYLVMTSVSDAGYGRAERHYNRGVRQH